jgi:hypothetical protein
MRRIADRIGIEWRPSLLRPKFNGQPVRANSSDPSVQREGILSERAAAFSLDPATLERIAQLAGDRYDRVAAVA